MWKLFFILTILVLTSIIGHSQVGSPTVYRTLNKIKGVPSWYTTSHKYDKTKKDRFKGVDSVYVGIAKLDTNAIVKLIDFLADTSSTTIPNTCQNGYFTYGQLAFFLINDIEPIPFYIVTKSQWDVLGECGILPYGFLNYLKNNASRFETEYRTYFNSQERQEWLKQIRKKIIRRTR